MNISMHINMYVTMHMNTSTSLNVTMAMTMTARAADTWCDGAQTSYTKYDCHESK
jgi:hypothetical protein